MKLNKELQKKYMTPDGPKPEIAAIPPAAFISITGEGDPSPFLDFADILRNVMKAIGQELGPLEALWWAADDAEMTSENIDFWRWKVMLRLSEEINDDELAQAVAEVRTKDDSLLLNRVLLDTYDEGEVVQLLFTGSLKNKSREMKELKTYAQDHGYEFSGKYHEIYFDDPGESSPLDAQTVLRQPIKKAI